MKKFLSIIIMLVAFMAGAAAKGDKMPQYDITGAGSGTEGTVLVKVYVYAKSAKDEELKRAAVHGVVFRGCTGNASGARQPAMASPAAEADNAAFCEAFFAADGQCQNYASVVAGSYDRVKTKKGYKVGAILQVDKTSLRKELEKAGVVRSLSSGF
ncbi:MAG: hypothetical protein Q4E63_07905 [Prevotellaceae bacterium]|nr:hypothetical protein [Prevotellaceae bacterium]MDO4932550.1 hypothetical protein [Prevotellaceae bacterium]